MILVNDKQVEFTKFPDGTTSFRFSPHLPTRMFAQPMEPPIFSITWKYDDDEECILLWYLTNHIRENNQRPIIRLSLPYIPNARMDRVKNADEVFTLKWFAEFINALGFDRVLVSDPHSNVSTALFDRVCVIDAQPNIRRVLDKLNDKMCCCAILMREQQNDIHRKLVESMCSASSTETGAPGKSNGWN